jgi:hypothetical protein
LKKKTDIMMLAGKYPEACRGIFKNKTSAASISPDPLSNPLSC